MSKRDELRAATLGAVKPRRCVMVYWPPKPPAKDAEPAVPWDGDEFEVREPSVREYARLKDEAGIKGGKPVTYEIGARYAALQVIACTYEPGTDKRVFEPADMDALMNLPESGSFLDELYSAVRALLVEADAAGKDSGKTQSSPGPSA